MWVAGLLIAIASRLWHASASDRSHAVVSSHTDLEAAIQAKIPSITLLADIEIRRGFVIADGYNVHIEGPGGLRPRHGGRMFLVVNGSLFLSDMLLSKAHASCENGCEDNTGSVVHVQSGSSARISNCTITENESASGGAISTDEGSLVIFGTKFFANTASSRVCAAIWEKANRVFRAVLCGTPGVASY